MKKEDLEITEDLIKDFSKGQERRALLRKVKQETEPWRDYNEVKGEIK